jgi:hypothetical protein
MTRRNHFSMADRYSSCCTGPVRCYLCIPPAKQTQLRDTLWLRPALPAVGVQPWHDDITLLVMEDLCAGYKQPCIIDIKASGHVRMMPGTLQDARLCEAHSVPPCMHRNTIAHTGCAPAVNRPIPCVHPPAMLAAPGPTTIILSRHHTLTPAADGHAHLVPLGLSRPDQQVQVGGVVWCGVVWCGVVWCGVVVMVMVMVMVYAWGCGGRGGVGGRGCGGGGACACACGGGGWGGSSSLQRTLWCLARCLHSASNEVRC